MHTMNVNLVTDERTKEMMTFFLLVQFAYYVIFIVLLCFLMGLIMASTKCDFYSFNILLNSNPFFFLQSSTSEKIGKDEKVSKKKKN